MTDFEKLGAFYLGRPYDLAKRERGGDWLLYDSRDLVTHAVCVGMTGSGKTGLCLSLLEEAAIDGVPAIVIDPKGDLGNLMLTFPELRPEEFAPWVNPEDARRKGVSVEDYARQQAELWKNGLAEWGQDGGRIARLRESADVVIYTPGSEAGLPVSILKSLAAPAGGAAEEGEAFRERVTTTVTSLLGLLGIEADPVKSRDHILLSTLLDTSWRAGRDVDLATLIQQIQSPPMTRVGVFDLESFYPSKERFGLAMAVNNLLASPGFNSWMTGDPLDIQQMLYTAEGKPRIAIFSISHLGDSERMFFVSLLLNQVVGWMRAQGGTTSLRALVYMDEIAGYFPPVANPPSKAPLLTLLEAGAGVRAWRGAGDAEPRGSRLQGALQRGHVVPRPAADRARQGARDRGARGGGGDGGRHVRPGEDGADACRAWQPHLPDEQRARGSARRLRDAVGALVSARSARAAGNQAADGPDQVDAIESVGVFTSVDAITSVGTFESVGARGASLSAFACRLRRDRRAGRRPFEDHRPSLFCRPASISISCRCAAGRLPARGSSTRRCCSASPRCVSPTPRPGWTPPRP